MTLRADKWLVLLLAAALTYLGVEKFLFTASLACGTAGRISYFAVATLELLAAGSLLLAPPVFRRGVLRVVAAGFLGAAAVTMWFAYHPGPSIACHCLGSRTLSPGQQLVAQGCVVLLCALALRATAPLPSPSPKPGNGAAEPGP